MHTILKTVHWPAQPQQGDIYLLCVDIETSVYVSA